MRRPGPSLFRVMEIALEELVSRWRGQRATVAFDFGRYEVEETRQTFHYEERLDGPLLRRCFREWTRVGTSVVSEDIAIDGSYISFETGAATQLIDNGHQRGEARLANGSASRLRLSTTPSGDASTTA
jgi:hypothetical protein